MERSDIRDRVFAILEDQIVPNVEFDEATRLVDLGYDSIDVIDIALVVEDEFDIEIPDGDLDSMHTVEDVILLVETILSQK